MTTDKAPTVNLENIIDPKRFSSFDKLLCITAYVIHFVSRLYSKQQKDIHVFPKTLKVETEEVSHAERLWVKSLQNVFHDNPSYDQLKNQLGVVLTEYGVLSCRGRLQHSKQPSFAEISSTLIVRFLRDRTDNQAVS